MVNFLSCELLFIYDIYVNEGSIGCGECGNPFPQHTTHAKQGDRWGLMEWGLLEWIRAPTLHHSPLDDQQPSVKPVRLPALKDKRFRLFVRTGQLED